MAKQKNANVNKSSSNNPKETSAAKIKILAIVIAFVSLFLFIALLSYNKQDQANAEISFLDLFGLISGDELIILKAETTQNLLGLLGAYISNFFYNHTSGYSSLIFPIILMLWSTSLFRELEVNREVLRKTYLLILISITFSSLMGTIVQLEISSFFSNEWAGVIGLFISNFTMKLAGATGSLLIFTFLLLLELYYTFGLKIDKIFESMLNQSTNIITVSKEKLNQIKENAIIESEEIGKEFDKEVNSKDEITTESSEPSLTTTPNSEENINEIPQVQEAQEATPKLTIKTSAEEEQQTRFITKSVAQEPVNINFNQQKTSNNPLSFIPGIGKKVNVTFNYPSPAQTQNIHDNLPFTSQAINDNEEVDIREIIQKQMEEQKDKVISEHNTITQVEQSPQIPKIQKDGDTQDLDLTKTSVPKKTVNQHQPDFDLNKELENLNTYITPAITPANTNLHAITVKSPEVTTRVAIEQTENEQENKDVQHQLLTPNVENEENEEKIAHADPLEALYNKLKEPGQSFITTPPPLSNTVVNNPLTQNRVETVLTRAVNTPEQEKPQISINYGDKISYQTEEKPLKYVLSTEIHDEHIHYLPPKNSYLLPDLNENTIDEEELRVNGEILQEKLLTFKITIEDLQITPGPVVTLYEFIPSDGIKISKIQGLENDLAMALKAKGIRIIAPIPGKGTVGIEIPNNKRQTIRFSAMVESNEFKVSKSYLPLALGKDVSGNVIIADLAKMPHLLIAGTTGSGKSVGINTIILSLLYKKHPSELKFIIVDPKKVELQQYAALSQHFIASSPDVRETIITNPSEAVMILKSAVIEMEQRYTLLASVGQRNLFDYNEKVEQGQLKGKDGIVYKKLPFIVVIIDELADLMLTASKEIEEPIVRLAQMARAVGIHLILATQRPSVKVITGLIKANFPARIAYTVKSNMDSRVILDVSGAEQLLGYGDMLFMSTDLKQPTRIQNSFLTTDEVETVCQNIGEQVGYSKPYMLPSTYQSNGDIEGGNFDFGNRDDLFEDAARFFIQQKTASTSILQRRFRIGYARAGKLVDELEAAGVIGPANGSKPRLVLYESEADLERIL